MHARLALLGALAVLGACAPRPPALGPEPVGSPVSAGAEALPDEPRPQGPPRPTARTSLLGDATYDLPVEANSWVEAEVTYLATLRADVVRRWLERTDRYTPFVRAVLRQHGLPEDLVYLATIESGYDPLARSRSGAVGWWQFMPGTARAEGLRIDSLVDERRDPVRSTYAAARHLRGLYETFGDWALAAAAYNAGAGKIRREIERVGSRSFWDLATYGALSDETKRYVPRLYAVAILAKNRDRYGLPAPAPTPPFAVDSVLVDYPIPLRELARLGGIDPDALAALNPHLLTGLTPEGLYWVWVPPGTGAQVQLAYRRSDLWKYGGFRLYRLRPGDDLPRLLLASGWDRERFRELNPQATSLRPGQTVVLPAAAVPFLVASPPAVASSASDGEGDEPPMTSKPARVAARSDRSAEPGRRGPASDSPSGTRSSSSAPSAAGRRRAAATADPTFRRVHVVADGETLWGLARRYGTTVEALRAANDLEPGAILQPGQRLRLPAAPRDSAAPSASARAAADRRATDTRSETPAREHIVAPGETLWSLARRYGTTVEALQRANDLDSTTLRPGMRLRIPVASGGR